MFRRLLVLCFKRAAVHDANVQHGEKFRRHGAPCDRTAGSLRNRRPAFRFDGGEKCGSHLSGRRQGIADSDIRSAWNAAQARFQLREKRDLLRSLRVTISAKRHRFGQHVFGRHSGGGAFEIP